MDILLIILGTVFMLIGIAGCILPILPGPPISYIGLLILHFTTRIDFSNQFLIAWALVTIAVSAADYFIPIWGTKKFGGSSYGIWGTNIGLIVGLLAPIPFGFIIGPFVGAFIGEIIYDNKDHQRALKAATGSFIGFLASSFLKFIVCVMHFGVFVWVVWQYKANLL